MECDTNHILCCLFEFEFVVMDEIGASIPQLRSIQDRLRGGATRAIIKAIFEIAISSIKTTKMLTIACVGFRTKDEL
jgi:hypothetical protein